jgi:hypothetical protein
MSKRLLALVVVGVCLASVALHRGFQLLFPANRVTEENWAQVSAKGTLNEAVRILGEPESLPPDDPALAPMKWFDIEPNRVWRGGGNEIRAYFSGDGTLSCAVSRLPRNPTFLERLRAAVGL